MKTKVLAFIDWYKPGYKAGGTVTAFSNFVDHLENNFDFNIITRDRDYFENESYENIISDTWIKRSKTKVYYLSKKNEKFITLRSFMDKVSFDLIYINGIFSLFFSIIPVLLVSKKPCIVNPHGMLSDQAFSVKSFKKKIFLSFANLLAIYKNITFHVANTDEEVAVKKRIKCYKSIKVVNQLPQKIIFNTKGNVRSRSSTSRFVCVSRISKEKGILKMIKVFQKVKEPLVLDIYGPLYDLNYWNLCKIEIKKLPTNIIFNYKGSIDSKKVVKTIEKYDFFILLSEGENFGHAILEALTVGLPMIISNKTPWVNLKEKGLGYEVDVNSYEIPQLIEVFL